MHNFTIPSCDICFTGHVLAMPLDNSLGYIGLFITKEDFRGHGYGTKVMKEALNSLKGRNVLLNAVEGTLDIYAKYGFKQSEMTSIDIIGAVGKMQNAKHESINMEPISRLNVNCISDYDRRITSINRWDHMPQWLLSNASVCYMAVEENSGKVLGYGAIRKAHGFYKIMPLYADSDEIASALFQTLLDTVPKDTKVKLRIPIKNKDKCLQVLKPLGTFKAGTLVEFRLHTISDVLLPYHQIYSLANTENTLI